MTTLLDRFTSTPEGMRLFQQERAIQEVPDLICEFMDADNVTRSELAERLGTSKGYVTQFLDGRANMTLRTVSDVFGALGREIHFAADPASGAGASRSRRVAKRRTRSERAARRPIARRKLA